MSTSWSCSSGPIGAEDERFLRGLSQSALGSAAGRRPSGPRARRLRAARDRQSRVSAGAARRAARRRRSGGSTAGSSRRFTVPRRMPRFSSCCRQLIDERHAKFNGTLYQLEPDTKDSPGALRDLLAVRTIARLTDPALLGHGPADPARLDEAEDFLFRIRVDRASRAQAQSEHAEPRAAGKGGAAAWLCRRAAAAAGRAADGRLLPPRAHRQPLARMGPQDRAASGRRRTWCDRATASASSTWSARRASRTPGCSVFQAAIDHDTVVADEALALIQQHVDRYAAEDFFPTTVERDALLTFLKPRPGLYARLSEMHDRGLLGRIFPEFQLIFSRMITNSLIFIFIKIHPHHCFSS